MGWLLALAALAVVAARIFAHDATLLLIWLNSFTLYVFLPVYLVLLWAILRGRHILAAVCLAPIAAHLVWLSPDLAGPAPQLAGAAEAPRLRVVSTNVVADNDQLAELLAEIACARPDVLLIQEYHDEVGQELRRSGLAAKLPHQFISPERGWGGSAVFSKYPLENLRYEHFGYAPLMQFDLTIDGAAIHLYQIHPFAPARDGMRRMTNEFWDRVRPVLAADQRPFAIIGDFNATTHSIHLARLREMGLRSAHQDRGRGLATTWPNGKIPFVPPIRIDHAFLSPQVACLKIREGAGAGSDHRPLILDLSLPTGAAAAH